jgi:hypothetical protein
MMVGTMAEGAVEGSGTRFPLAWLEVFMIVTP